MHSADECRRDRAAPTAGRPRQNGDHNVVRHSVIGTSVAVVAALGLSACGGGGGGSDSAGSKTLRVTLVNHVWTDNIKKALPEFEKADRPQGRGHPARRGPALRPVQRQAQRRLQRHRRDDVPPAAGGEAVRQEQVPLRPGRQGQGRRELGLERLPGRPGELHHLQGQGRGRAPHHRAGGPVLPQGPAEEGRHRQPAEDPGRAEGRRREGRGRQPRRRRASSPGPASPRRSPSSPASSTASAATSPTRSGKADRQHRRRPSRPTPSTAGC